MTELNKRFLENRDETGKYIVYSIRTGRSYYVEPIGDGRGGDWGSENPATKQIEHKKGDGKYTGSVTEKDSFLVENNKEFQKIHVLGTGVSVGSAIDEIDANYPNKEDK